MHSAHEQVHHHVALQRGGASVFEGKQQEALTVLRISLGIAVVSAEVGAPRAPLLWSEAPFECQPPVDTSEKPLWACMLRL